MNLRKLLRVENIDLMLGRPMKEASHKKMLNLLIVSIIWLTVEKTRARKKKKDSSVARELRLIAEILHKEALRRMKTKTT
ncbi:MAG: hypothetical protein AAB345_01485 [Patescibacteria group bacterium]